MAKNPLIARLEQLDLAPKGFINEVEKAQASIFKNLLKKLNNLELDETGNILLSKKNIAQIETIGADLEQIIIGKGTRYYNAVGDFLKDMDQQKDINTSFFTKNFDFKNDPDFDALFQSSKNRAVDQLANAAVKENVSAFKDVLQNAIASKDKHTSLIENIQTQIMGNDQVDGKLLRYARQNATDLYSIADREYVNAISEDLGVIFYQYAGGVIATTRPFCRKRNGKIFHKNEIAGWATESWAGKVKSTNENTIFSLLGGYLCQHVLVPIALEYVPIEDILRNIENGNIDRESLPDYILEKI